MIIPEFDKWFIDEGFKADINADDKKENEIEIESPNEGNNNTYVINGDKVKTKKQIASVDKSGHQKDIKIKSENIDDEKLKKDIITATYAINRIKNRVKADEIDRLTGGDLTNSTKDIISILDSEINDEITPNVLYNSLGAEFFGNDGKGKHIYLDISKIRSKYKIHTKKNIYDIAPHSIGKGEYLLPLLFDDVYKEKVHGEKTKGDNYILNGTTKYNLELKCPGASLSFSKSEYEEIQESSKENGANIKDILKNIVIKRFIRYSKNQQRNNRNNLILCFFNEDKNKKPIGILFINVSNITNDDTYIFENLIDISDNTISSGDFKYTFNGDNKEPKIICKINKKYYPTTSESLILSRDNFVNEIYKK